MAHDPDTVPVKSAATLRASVIEAGHSDGPEGLRILREGLASDDAMVRSSALSGLDRRGALSEEVLQATLGDADAEVRIRAAQIAGSEGWSSNIDIALKQALQDPHDLVVIAVLVSLADRRPPGVVDVVVALAGDDERPLVMEEAVASLGALGDQRGLGAVLAATSGKPALRRRCVAALGGFEGADVEDALDRLSEDRDWQVRQAVAMLRREPFDEDSAVS